VPCCLGIQTKILPGNNVVVPNESKNVCLKKPRKRKKKIKKERMYDRVS
jgi:hypothetical protein